MNTFERLEHTKRLLDQALRWADGPHNPTSQLGAVLIHNAQMAAHLAAALASLESIKSERERRRQLEKG